MTKIRKISIFGAGAMGAAYAAMFSDAGDFSVSFVARGERYKRLKQGSLTVNGKRYAVPVIHPDEVTKPADLILVALKHHHLPDALQNIKSLAGRDTIILSVMNGLESEEIIGSVCGTEKIVYATAVGIDAIREVNRFNYTSPGKIIFGDGPRSLGGNRLERLKEALSRASIPNEVPTDMMRMMWWKFMINVGINQASAVLRAPYGIFQTSPDAKALMRSLMQEVIAVAQKINIDLSPKDLDEWNKVLSTLSPMGKTSMLQDIEAGRKTEVEVFGGKVVAMGEKHQVPTPVNETVLRIIKVIESNEAWGCGKK
ncbi:MAG: 2-dehydropantoate 2-reductase [Desulfobacterales bacterium]|jgi:2-dehydropantoate 2-reductase